MPEEVENEVQPTESTAAPEGGAPAVGQGEGPATTSGLYSLDSFPESIRGQVEPIFKEWDANVTREFQKRSEALDGWKPYEELGVRDISPEDMSHLKAFYEIATDEDAFSDWVKEAAQSLGLLEAAPAVEGGAEAGAEGAAGDGTPTRDEVERMLSEREQAREEEAKQQEMVDQIAREVRETLDGLKGEFSKAHGEELWDEELISFLAQRHQKAGASASDVLKSGFADFQRMLNASASSALDAKATQPAATAVTAGRANSAPAPAKSFDEAGERLLERLRAS